MTVPVREREEIEIETVKAGVFDMPRFAGGLFLLVALLAAAGWLLPESSYGRVQTFVTIFLGIFVEAVPFLLAGSIVSGLLDIFVPPDLIARLAPRNAVLGSLTGAMLGFVFPVCECGVVPVTRRLYEKGLPLSVGIAFLLAAPVINPIVLASTYAAFGWGPVLIGRYVITFAIAFLVGLIFTRAKPAEILPVDSLSALSLTHGASCAHDHHDHDHDLDYDEEEGEVERNDRLGRFWAAMATAGNDFFDMARYLIAGSLMAAAMQTLVPQGTLLALGSGEFLSVITMMVLAFVLSICSTVDAFLALSFAQTFTTGSILAFLSFGPMVDIKSSMMFLGVFRRRVVLFLIIFPLLFNLLVALMINYFTFL